MFRTSMPCQGHSQKLVPWGEATADDSIEACILIIHSMKRRGGIKTERSSRGKKVTNFDC